MKKQQHLFIAGSWQLVKDGKDLPVRDSYTEEIFASYRCASSEDVDKSVLAARTAFESWSATPLADRIAGVRRIASALRIRSEALTQVISREVGMPTKLAARIQVGGPIAAWDMYADLASQVEWERRIGNSLVRSVPIGVVACITPWNYPLHQITGKVAPALLAGCTVVLKPSELAPSSAFLLAEAVEEAGLPPGVFNLVHGTGSEIGEALITHPEIDMVSFTGSTGAGKRIASLAASDIKHLSLELGGKSAAIVLADADLAAAVKGTLASCFLNSGQTCSAITRLLVPRELVEATAKIAADLAPSWSMGDPTDSLTRLGPLISHKQREKVSAMVNCALDEGAERVTPEGPLPNQGFFFPPTVLNRVTPQMVIAREEVFGPVLAIIAYENVEDAISIANGTDYGLAAAVWSSTPDGAMPVARRLRAGQVDINGAPFNPLAPFGGFKHSVMGRENGRFGIEEFLQPVSLQFPPSHFETL